MFPYFEKVSTEMYQKYGISDNTPILDLSAILNDKDWKKLSGAMKYPNGVVREIECDTKKKIFQK